MMNAFEAFDAFDVCVCVSAMLMLFHCCFLVSNTWPFKSRRLFFIHWNIRFARTIVAYYCHLYYIFLFIALICCWCCCYCTFGLFALFSLSWFTYIFHFDTIADERTEEKKKTVVAKQLILSENVTKSLYSMHIIWSNTVCWLCIVLFDWKRWVRCAFYFSV